MDILEEAIRIVGDADAEFQRQMTDLLAVMHQATPELREEVEIVGLLLFLWQRIPAPARSRVKAMLK